MRWRPMVATGSEAAARFYDSRRGIYYAKPVPPRLDASDLVGAIPRVRPVPAGPRPWSGADRDGRRGWASVSGLFGTSALYHRGTWTEAWRQRLQRLDHAMISSSSPARRRPPSCSRRPGPSVVCLIVMGTLTIAVALIHSTWMNAPELLVGGASSDWAGPPDSALPWMWIHVVSSSRSCSASAACIPSSVDVFSFHHRWPGEIVSFWCSGFHAGLPRLRLCRRGLPVRRDRLEVHRLNRRAARS